MPPKKREKDLDTQKSTRMDQIQADHELFLQAFESEYNPFLFQYRLFVLIEDDNFTLIHQIITSDDHSLVNLFLLSSIIQLIRT